MRQKDYNEIITYLINNINSLWNRNKDFVAVYGRDYPKKQLAGNLRKILFNQTPQENSSGEFFLPTRTIHLYNDKYPIHSLRELKRSTIRDLIMSALNHELVHSIFSKNLDTEEDPNKLITGLEIYDEKLGGTINLPLNEGYTEYIRSLLDGDTHNSYRPFTNVFYILERKLGKRGIIALSKGDVAENLASAFNMTLEEFLEFARDSEIKFIREKKMNILEYKYNEFGRQYSKKLGDSMETRDAILRFDKDIHVGLYGVSIMDILPLGPGEVPSLKEFRDFMKYKLDGLHKQAVKFHRELYDRAMEATRPKVGMIGNKIYVKGAITTSSVVAITTESVESRHDSFVVSLRKLDDYETAKKDKDKKHKIPCKAKSFIDNDDLDI